MRCPLLKSSPRPLVQTGFCSCCKAYAMNSRNHWFHCFPSLCEGDSILPVWVLFERPWWLSYKPREHATSPDASAHYLAFLVNSRDFLCLLTAVLGPTARRSTTLSGAFVTTVVRFCRLSSTDRRCRHKLPEGIRGSRLDRSDRRENIPLMTTMALHWPTRTKRLLHTGLGLSQIFCSTLISPLAPLRFL